MQFAQNLTPAPEAAPAGAADLARSLVEIKRLEDRIAAIRAAFSTSLGVEDRRCCAIWAAGPAIEVFTLDTGRLFQETAPYWRPRAP